MKINSKEHDILLMRIDSFLSEIEELGVSACILGFSCNIEEVGWVACHMNLGDPLTGRALAQDYIAQDDDDGGDIIFSGYGPSGDSDEWNEMP